ncbi:SET domain-containing protein [Priestia megaterium]|uniref:SET domain-containing protein n=1 Tax=Priestia megaterium TaxID=1404 RepID=UPI003D2D7549
MLISVKDTQKYGRGIYATCNIKIGELIESSPIILVNKEELQFLAPTKISNYWFYWGQNSSERAIALGYGSLFNHSYSPNCIYYYNERDLTIKFYALTNIKQGDEIKINYNGDPYDYSPLWFDIIN